MASPPINSVGAFWLASIAGAYVGTLVQGLWSLARGGSLPSLWQEPAVAPIVVLGFGTLALPAVALGLTIFGLPLGPSLRRYARRPWLAVVAALWGAVAGKLTFAAMEYATTARGFRPLQLRLPDPGLCYGIATGLAWWWLERLRARPPRA